MTLTRSRAAEIRVLGVLIRRWRPALFGLLALAVLVPTGRARAEVQEGGVLRIPAPMLEKLIIRNPQGSVTLRGWDRQEIFISFHKRALTTAMLDLLRTQYDRRQGAVFIHSGVIVRGELRELPQPDSSLDLTIDAPRYVQLLASTFSGELQASGFRSGVDAGCDTGVIRVTDVSGQVRTHAGRGDQWLQSIQGEVNATGVDGDVDLLAVEGPSLFAQVVTGQITARDIRSPLVRLHAAVGTLLLLGALVPGGHYELHVDEGDVQVGLPDRPTLHFAIEARGAQVRNPFRLDPGATQAPGYVRGEVRGGGPTLQLTSTQGLVILLPLP